MRRPRPWGITHRLLIGGLYGGTILAYLKGAEAVLHTQRFLPYLLLAIVFFAPAGLIHAWLNRVIRDRGAAV